MGQHLSDPTCFCNVCRKKKQQSLKESFPPMSLKVNNLFQFIKLLPRNFPLEIVPTSFLNHKLHYHNKYKNRMISQQWNKMTQNFPLATHIILYYENSSKIIYKYELHKYNQNFLYIQSYQTQSPINFQYTQGCVQKFDEILSQKIEVHLKQIIKDEHYCLSEKEKQSQRWIHREYGDKVFVQFMTCLYCNFVKMRTAAQIKRGVFEWIVEGIQQIRLLNVKDIEVKYPQEHRSFQEEYEEKILEKINNIDGIFISPIEPKKSKFQTNKRLKNFKDKIKHIYNREKTSILQKTEKERTTQSETISDDIGRFFLPELKNHSSLREVLNNEQKFKEVVLRIKPKKPDLSLSREKRSKMKLRNYRIKTEY